MKLPKTRNGRCSECGCETLTLAEDLVLTRYSNLNYSHVQGEWVRSNSRSEDDVGDAPDPTRLFCSECYTYHELPEGVLL